MSVKHRLCFGFYMTYNLTKSPMTPSKPSQDSANYLFLVLPRFALLWVCVALIPVSILFHIWWLLFIATCLTCLGVYNISQKRHAILRNYPISGHIRFCLKIFAQRYASILSRVTEKKYHFHACSVQSYISVLRMLIVLPLLVV